MQCRASVRELPDAPLERTNTACRALQSLEEGKCRRQLAATCSADPLMLLPALYAQGFPMFGQLKKTNLMAVWLWLRGGQGQHT